MIYLVIGMKQHWAGNGVALNEPLRISISYGNVYLVTSFYVVYIYIIYKTGCNWYFSVDTNYVQDYLNLLFVQCPFQGNSYHGKQFTIYMY